MIALVEQMTTLYDAYGRPVYPGGITVDDVHEAIRAALLADDRDLAHEIATRYDIEQCVFCGDPEPTLTQLPQWGCTKMLCDRCVALATAARSGADLHLYLNGLIRRDVQ